MSTIYRVIHPQLPDNPPPHLDDWLDLLEREREQTIARLRAIDMVLVKYQRLKAETLERRAR